eukprot:g242.t1
MTPPHGQFQHFQTDREGKSTELNLLCYRLALKHPFKGHPVRVRVPDTLLPSWLSHDDINLVVPVLRLVEKLSNESVQKGIHDQRLKELLDINVGGTTGPDSTLVQDGGGDSEEGDAISPPAKKQKMCSST